MQPWCEAAHASAYSRGVGPRMRRHAAPCIVDDEPHRLLPRRVGAHATFVQKLVERRRGFRLVRVGARLCGWLGRLGCCRHGCGCRCWGSSLWRNRRRGSADAGGNACCRAALLRSAAECCSSDGAAACGNRGLRHACFLRGSRRRRSRVRSSGWHRGGGAGGSAGRSAGSRAGRCGPRRALELVGHRPAALLGGRIVVVLPPIRRGVLFPFERRLGALLGGGGKGVVRHT
eukprot:105840-Chlamydomonas_euryale.AAC.1